MKVLHEQNKLIVSRKKPSWILRVIAVPLWLVLLAQPLAPLFASEILDSPTPTEEIVVEEHAESLGAVGTSDTEIQANTDDESDQVNSADDRQAVDESALAVEEVITVTSVRESEENAFIPESPDVHTPQPDNVDGAVIDSVPTAPTVVIDVASASTSLSSESTNTATTTEPNADIEEPAASTTNPDQSSPDPTPETPQTQPELPKADSAVPTTDTTNGLPDTNDTSTTTTEVEDAPLTVINHVAVSDENRYSFARDECALMGDGVYYCTKPDTNDQTSVVADGVMATPDADGDREIFITRNGETVQVTNNQDEDDAPFYDNVSKTIVWHRLIDGRYQIVSYSLERGEETVLTNDRFNNMHPTRDDEVLVWQAWVGDDWEIMVESNGELQMITDNTVQDISPRINGEYIVWQSFEDGAWRVKVYDQSTGSIDTIADSAGASVQNPRFVLVYDAEQENGDVETMGYDLHDKVTVPLSATPAPIPQKLPDPEQTGEERALVQPTTNVKQKVGTGDEDPLDDTPDSDGGGVATTTDYGTTTDIIIPAYDDAPDSAIATSTDADNDSSEPAVTPETDVVEELSEIFDVVIPAVEESVPPVEDLIITPYVEPMGEAAVTDSQSTVASST